MSPGKFKKVVLERGYQIMLPDAENTLKDLMAWIETEEGIWELYELYNKFKK